jgi:hypothetical protein
MSCLKIHSSHLCLIKQELLLLEDVFGLKLKKFWNFIENFEHWRPNESFNNLRERKKNDFFQLINFANSIFDFFPIQSFQEMRILVESDIALNELGFKFPHVLQHTSIQFCICIQKNPIRQTIFYWFLRLNH